MPVTIDQLDSIGTLEGVSLFFGRFEARREL